MKKQKNRFPDYCVKTFGSSTGLIVSSIFNQFWDPDMYRRFGEVQELPDPVKMRCLKRILKRIEEDIFIKKILTFRNIKKHSSNINYFNNF